MRIGILEDDPSQIELYQLWFATAQHVAFVYATLAQFLSALEHEKFDVLLIDRVLPDGNGETALKWVREHLGWEIPVIFVSADRSEIDIVHAIRMGADDYVIKPPHYFELLARIDAWGRRAKQSNHRVLKFGAYEIDTQNREIIVAGQPVDLTQKEFELASYLFNHPGKLLSRIHLLEAIWSLQSESEMRTVDTHVSRIRRKLFSEKQYGWEIVSVYGYGYRMEVQTVTA